MSEDFKKKIKDYMEGRLSGEEKDEIEKEIEKIDKYQSVIEELVEREETDKIPDKSSNFINGKENKILRRGKWKARFQNALTAIGIILGVTIISGIITSLFYTIGRPNKVEVYRDVVASTIAVTQPNVRLSGSGTSVNPYFTMGIEASLSKMVGASDIKAGNINVLFLFGQAGFPKRQWFLDENRRYLFSYPAGKLPVPVNSEWVKLEKLPEGTVAEAFLSFDRLYGTDEILGKFKDVDTKPLWFAVDTGVDDLSDEKNKFEFTPIGFPYNPLWHSSDWTVIKHSEGKWGDFGKTVTESAVAPELDPYGSGKVRDENFINTLSLLKEYEGIADRIANGPQLNIGKRIEYLKSHGVNIYGMVVTGPTKELLKLKENPLITGIRLGEVRLWDWD